VTITENGYHLGFDFSFADDTLLPLPPATPDRPDIHGRAEGTVQSFIFMTRNSKSSWLILMLLSCLCSVIAEPLPTNGKNDALQIRAINVNGQRMPLSHGTPAYLKPFSKNIAFIYGPDSNSSWTPLRLRYRLDGYENSWHEDEGQMCLTARFFDEANNQISETQFYITGSSPGWRGQFKDSSLDHRHETVVAPPSTARLMIIFASAGPPSTVGVYAITDLAVSRISTNKPPELLLQFPDGTASSNWVRDGTHPTMAQIVELGKDAPSRKALAIIDTDLRAHAEWHNAIQTSPRLKPGDRIAIEWSEMYNIADGLGRVARYANVPPGQYRFQVAELNVMGNPTGIETSLPVVVLQPMWRRPFFWVASFIGFSALIAGGMYYLARRKIRSERLRYESQRELEYERLRIARDIHDDLGVRVTQISLASAMAQENPMYPEQARADFEHVSQMARDLVAALYETVWTVTPSNDNLKELGNYLFQISNKLFARTECLCRFYVDDLPQEITVSSHVRHNICMAAKEALHNVIKHAKASEASIRIIYHHKLLTILIQDNGCGFDIKNSPTGSGLVNLRRRLSDIGGQCDIRSQPGQGTVVELSLTIPSPAK
jgi:signal transduction histidine kinase